MAYLVNLGNKNSKIQQKHAVCNPENRRVVGAGEKLVKKPGMENSCTRENFFVGLKKKLVWLTLPLAEEEAM